MRAVILLLAVCAVHSLFTPIDDSNIYHSQFNWYHDQQRNSLETTNAGAYLKFNVNGTTNLVLILDATTTTLDYAKIGWSVDNGPITNVTVPSVGTRIQLFNNSQTTQTHNIFLYIKNLGQFLDRWQGPAANIRLLGLEADDTVKFFVPTLLKKRILAYWDSIGEGVNTVAAPGGDLFSNDALLTWAFSAAEALDAELGIVAFGGQGWTATGLGGVPPLWNADGDNMTSAWRWYSSKHQRDFSQCPDYILNGHGTNDGLSFSPKPAEVLIPLVTGWLKSMRQTCPKSHIFQVVPFGLFEAEAIEKGLNKYKSASGDRRAHLIQLGPEAARGLTWFGASFCSSDGVHPLGWRSSQLGAMLAVKIAAKL
ncbi:hypothetical protein PROFUN_09544 [Planoprotostelium fungivorum]|uniref:SGNH hydrolase-type esterase domain-containing protein n=1 Tax=Planoprotostelium fungivorum TaxID=1890364 RepID=A0A2P6MT19_9EUKA|nr:hypothetical protein PROFUN_09544 [Planoprotostelium fungivorum]